MLNFIFRWKTILYQYWTGIGLMALVLLGLPLLKALVPSLEFGFVDLYMTHWFAWGSMGAVVFFLWKKKHWMRTCFSGIGWKWWLWLSALLIATLLCVLVSAPAQPRVESNESILLSTAQNLHSHKTAGSCDEAEFQKNALECLSTSPHWQPKLPSLIYAVLLWFFPTHMHWAYGVQLGLLVLMGFIAFLAVHIWTGNPFLALLAATFQVSQPLLFFHARSLTATLWYLLLFWLVLLFWKLAENTSDKWMWSLLGLWMGLWALTDPLALWVVIPFTILILFSPVVANSPTIMVKNYFAIAFSLAIIPAVVNQVFFLHTSPDWATPFSFHHLFESMPVLWRSMTMVSTDVHGYLQTPYLTSTTILAVMGLLCVLFRSGKLLLDSRFLAAIFLCAIPLGVLLGRAMPHTSLHWIQQQSLMLFPGFSLFAAFCIQQLFAWTSPSHSGERSLVPSSVWGGVIGVLILGLSARYYDTYHVNRIFADNALTEEERLLQSWVTQASPAPRLYLYSRPWFFVGQGISAFGYAHVADMDSTEIAPLIQKYQGEVYYIRGIDCRSSQEQEITASLCGSLEQTLHLDPIWNEGINNEYDLSIQKVRGILSYKADSLVQIETASYHTDTRKIVIQYRLSQIVPLGWKIKIQAGLSSLSRDFVAGLYRDTLNLDGAEWKPGYHDVRVLVYDIQGGERAGDVYSLFESNRDEVVPLTDVPFVHQKQSWGDLQKNRSVKQNKLHVNGIFYGAGLGTHAYSRIEYNLGGSYRLLEAIVGQDDEEPNGDGVRVQVWGDGKLLWMSVPVHAPLSCATKTCASDCAIIAKTKTKSADTAHVQLHGVQQMVLIVDSLSNNACDHADIINPILYREK